MFNSQIKKDIEKLKKEIEDRARFDDLPFLEDIKDDISNLKFIIKNSELEDVNCSFLASSDDLENVESTQRSILHNIDELKDDIEDRIQSLSSNDLQDRVLFLEKENQDLKERLLTIENFLNKVLKGFSDV